MNKIMLITNWLKIWISRIFFVSLRVVGWERYPFKGDALKTVWYLEQNFFENKWVFPWISQESFLY